MSHTTALKIYDTPEKVYTAIADCILDITAESESEFFDIALSGGNSPKGLFKKLGEKYKTSIPWQRIRFWWGDERCVPPADEESNYKMTVEHLFRYVDIPEQNVYRIRGEEEPGKEARRYARKLEELLPSAEGFPVFDLIILGLGDDGHTASIFPGHLDLFEKTVHCAVAEHPVTGQKRVTLTGGVLNSAKQVFFLVTGKNKAERVFEIQHNKKEAELLPAFYVAPQNGSLTWFLDAKAAALIS